MKIFGNTDKRHIRLAAAVLTASIVLSMTSMTGCAASGTSGRSENAQTEEKEEKAGQSAVQEAVQASTGLDDTGAETDGSSREKAAESEEAAGAAAAEAVKQGAASGNTAAAEAVKNGAASGSAAAEAVKQGTASGDTGTDHSEEASSGTSSVKDASESGKGTSESAGPEADQEADRKSGSGDKEEEIPEKPSVREDGGVSMNVFAMDTYMTLLAYGDQAEKAVLAAAKEIHKLDDMLSTGISTSEICRINAAGSGEISGDVETLIDKSLELYDKTDGLFNIAIYPVMKVWGFPTQEYRVPSGAEIEKALKLADVPAIELITEADMKKAQKAAAAAAEEVEKAQEAADQAAKQAADRKKAAEEKKAAGAAEGKTGQDQTSGEEADAEAADKAAADALKSAKEKLAAIKVPSAPSVSFKTKGMEIDLGGIAKGYTGDRVGEVFSRYKISSGIISLGGNVQAFGSKLNGKPWRVAVQNPESSLEYLGVLDVENKAVVTSGGYERYFEENGVRYHHIIDPRTGYPADSGLISATIVCDQGILADGLSTSLFIMGKDQAEKFWRESSWNFDYILEDKEGTLYVTEGIADSLTTDANVVIVNRYVEETDNEKK